MTAAADIGVTNVVISGTVTNAMAPMAVMVIQETGAQADLNIDTVGLTKSFLQHKLFR